VIPSDPNWPRASSWLAGEHRAEPVARLQVLGAPLREGSLSGGRFDLAPAAIRAALEGFSTFDGELTLDAVEVRDGGDLAVTERSPEEALDEIAGAVGGSLRHSEAVVLLGGDNSVTRPAVRGLGPGLDRVGLVTIDAHHDLRDTGGGLNNGNPVRALLEDGLPGSNVAQLGIQPFANSETYAAVARDAGIAVRTAAQVRERGLRALLQAALDELARGVDAIHVDLDLDVLDRAFAPACPGSRPGGLRPSDVLEAAAVAGEHPSVRGLDIVEVDPERDVAETTVLTAAGCLLRFASGLSRRSARRR
jgi:formiminoglutamase